MLSMSKQATSKANRAEPQHSFVPRLDLRIHKIGTGGSH